MKNIFVLSAMSALLVACGGSSGGSSAQTNDYPLVELSSESAEDIVAKSMASLNDTVDSGEVEVDSAASTDVLSIATRLREEFIDSSAQNRLKITVGDAECLGGGSVSYDSSIDLFKEGSWLQADYDNCIVFGTMRNGSVRIELSAVSLFDSVTAIGFDQFTVSNSLDSKTLDGDYLLSWEIQDGQKTSTVAVASMHAVNGDAESTVFSDLEITKVSGILGVNNTLDVRYNYAADEIGGRLAFETTQSLEFGFLQAMPHTGVMKISGANGTTVTLDADTGSLNTVYVTHDNGSSTTSNEVTWISLGSPDFSDWANH